MAIIKSEQVRKSIVDENGNETIDTYEKTTKIERSLEPDYIKIYTKMWCEFNEIPEKYRQLFLSLAIRMEYCNIENENDVDGLSSSQIVSVAWPHTTSIMKECGWETDSPLWKGLRALCDCGAIRKLRRSIYQINPTYAGKGSWKYNPKLEQGGIEDLITTFSFKDKTVDTKIIYQDANRDYTHKRVTVEDEMTNEIIDEVKSIEKQDEVQQEQEKTKKKRGRKKKETAA